MVGRKACERVFMSTVGWGVAGAEIIFKGAGVGWGGLVYIYDEVLMFLCV